MSPRTGTLRPLAGAAGATAATGAAGHTGTSAVRPKPAQAATATDQPATAVHHATAASDADTSGATLAAAKQTLSATGVNRNVIVLDPAHGGTDVGSHIGTKLLEKDVTLQLAFRLRSLLIARGFTVVLTRENDSPTEGNSAATPLTLDDRAGIANRMRPAACLLLHATGRGDGVHLYSSELDAATGETPQLPWLTAQAAWVPASQQLARNVASALGRSHISLVSDQASIRPLDSLTCPALVLELAPESSDPNSISDAAYGDRVASAVAGALVFWENQVQPPPKLSLSPTPAHTTHHHSASPKAAGELKP